MLLKFIHLCNFVDGVVLRQGSYLSATADIGTFEHSLTTDLLNHLVFVQKVFMKEVNEVVQKVYGGEKPVPLWLEDDESTNSTLKRILFSLVIRIKVKLLCIIYNIIFCYQYHVFSIIKFFFPFTENTINCNNSNKFCSSFRNRYRRISII